MIKAVQSLEHISKTALPSGEPSDCYTEPQLLSPHGTQVGPESNHNGKGGP
jgi:hypothetical protein